MKLFKYVDKKPIYYYKSNKQVLIPDVYIGKDFRAVWVSNVANIDLPTVENLELYKEKVYELLDTCDEFNINAVIFQVRTTNDAFYESKLNPYSRFFTGKEGKKPPFDILKWIIGETKKRGIEFHAWCNPYRVSVNGKLSVEEYLNSCDDLNFAKKQPDYIVLDKKGKLILNPAIKEVQDFIIASMVEIVENYDVDGLHFDDYFYPYSGFHDVYNDNIQFNNQTLELGDFRRKNVNDIIKGVYEAIKKVNSKVQFGVSPFGIWKNTKPNEFGSNTALGCTESYYALYADTLEWINKEYVDYIVPQVYWEFGHKIAPFADICDFWNKVCKDKKVDLYIGHATYRLGSEGEFSNKMEIVNQVKYANQYDTVKGNVFFTYKNFIDKEEAYQGMNELRKLLARR
jgi:uncharacterized lipoprotein YddW (UPF0748 family)